EIEIAAEYPVAGVGGPSSLSCRLLLPPGVEPAAVQRDALVEATVGGLPVFAGLVSDVDWATGAITAQGASRDGDEPAALTAAGVPSSTPDEAIDAAIARGAVSWTRPASISATA